MKAKISMQETLAEALQAIERAQKDWRKKPLKANDELRYTRAMCLRAEAALAGELEITDAK